MSQGTTSSGKYFHTIYLHHFSPFLYLTFPLYTSLFCTNTKKRHIHRHEHTYRLMDIYKAADLFPQCPHFQLSHTPHIAFNQVSVYKNFSMEPCRLHLQSLISSTSYGASSISSTELGRLHFWGLADFIYQASSTSPLESHRLHRWCLFDFIYGPNDLIYRGSSTYQIESVIRCYS